MRVKEYLVEKKEHKLTLILTDDFLKNLNNQVSIKQFTGNLNIDLDDLDFLGGAVSYAIRNNLKSITLKSSKERMKEREKENKKGG